MIDLSRALATIFRLNSAIPRAIWGDGRAFRPVHMFMEVTYRCNLRCNFCQYLDIIEGKAEPTGPVRGDIDIDSIKKCIDDMGRGRLISFAGGETLVRKDFPDILRYASRRHRTHIITNGVLVSPEIAELCVELAPRYIWQKGFVLMGVSLEGDEEVHDRVVQRPGSWRKTIDGVGHVVAQRRAQGKAFPKLHFNLVVTRDTVGEMVDFMRLAHDLGVDTVAFLAEHDIVGHSAGGRTERLQEMQTRPSGVDPEFLREQLIRCHEHEKQLGVQVRLSPYLPIDEFVRHYTDDRRLDPSQYACEGTWDRVAVGAGGEFAPACHYVRTGDVRSDSLDEVWNGERFREFRRGLLGDRVYAGCNGCCNLKYTGPKAHGLAGVATARSA